MENGFIRVKEVMKTLDCSESKAYKIMKKLNNELEAKNKIIIAGRVPRKYFMERLFI
jgi:hypothetical protein